MVNPAFSGTSETVGGRPGRPLRLLVITQHYWPESFRINSFVEELIAAGAEVTVLTGQPNYPAGKTLPGYRWYCAGRQRHPAGYDIFRVPLIARGKAGGMRLALNYLSFIAAGSIIGPVLLRGRRFDALFVYGTSPILQAFVGLPLRLIKRAPLAIWVQDLWPHALAATGYVRNARALAAVQAVVGWLYRRADLILGQSEAFVMSIRPHAGVTPVAYLPNPGDSEASDDSPSPRLPAGFNVVFAGNLGRAQSLDTVLEAATLLRTRDDIRIILFGSGAMQDWLSEAITQRGLANLMLGGRIRPEAMPGIYAQADALLLTLVDDPMIAQTIPSKLQSYLAAGRPVIAAAGGESARIVAQARAGLACAPEDPEALAATITALKDADPTILDAMCAAGRDYYRTHFEPQRLARDLLDRLSALAEACNRVGGTGR